MTARVRVINEVLGGDTPPCAIEVKVFEGPKIVDGEQGLAKVVDHHVIEPGTSRYFDVLGLEYLSIELYKPPVIPVPMS